MSAFAALQPDPSLNREPGTGVAPGPGTGPVGTGNREPGTGIAPEPGTGNRHRSGTGNREPGTGIAPEPGTGNREPAGSHGTGDREPGTAGFGPVPPVLGSRSVPGSELVPSGPVPMDRLGLPARMALALRDRVQQLAADQKNHKTFWHWAWTAFWKTPPQTLAQQLSYIQSRSWLEDWMTGWVRWVFEKENTAFGILVAIPAKAVLQNADKLFDRQWRIWAAGAVIGFGYVIYRASH